MTGDPNPDRNRLRELYAPPTIAPAEADALLRPTVCPKCEYRLAGLPEAGICPECGRAYGLPEVVLYGHGAGARASAWNTPRPSPWKLGLRWAFVLSIAAAFAPMGVGGRLWRNPSMLWWFLPTSLAGVVVATVRQFRGDGAGAVQVRLSPAGFHQGNRRGGPVPYARSADAAPVPWRRATDARLFVRAADGRLMIRILAPGPWWRPASRSVDAAVDCPPAAVEPLRQRVAAWRGKRPDRL